MTKTSPARISPLVLLLPMFLGMIAFASMRPGADSSTSSALAAQNTNTSGPKSAKKASTKVDCSKADDADLSAQIKKRLSKRPSLKNEKDINVDVKAGVATLSGSVRSKRHRATAVAEAKKVGCVTRVINDIIIKCAAGCSGNQYCCGGACQDQPCGDKPKKPK